MSPVATPGAGRRLVGRLATPPGMREGQGWERVHESWEQGCMAQGDARCWQAALQMPWMQWPTLLQGIAGDPLSCPPRGAPGYSLRPPPPPPPAPCLALVTGLGMNEQQRGVRVIQQSIHNSRAHHLLHGCESAASAHEGPRVHGQPTPGKHGCCSSWARRTPGHKHV